jgi:uncharacterized membrane protein
MTGTVDKFTAGAPPADRLRQRVATIDWMRGLVMILMIVDHGVRWESHRPRLSVVRRRHDDGAAGG